MPKIFISYRRSDSQTIAGRIYDRLVAEYGKRNVFKDVDDIPPGQDFRSVIRSAVTWCDVMLVIIGPKWLDVRDGAGSRRIDNPRDYVRLELEAGLRNDRLLVMPVLVHHADAPAPTDLPDTLRQFAFRNAVTIEEDPNFHRDMERLIDYLNDLNRPKSPRRKPLAMGTLVTAFLLTAALIAYLILRPDDAGDDQHGANVPTPTSTATQTIEPSPTASPTPTSTPTATTLPSPTPTSTTQPTPLTRIALPFMDDLENPVPQWLMEGGWTYVAYDGIESLDGHLIGQIDPAVDEMGTAILTLPSLINLADTRVPMLYFWERTNLATRGLARVEVRSDQAGDWEALWDRAGVVNYAETRVAINLEAYAGQVIQLRFELVVGEADPDPILWWLDDISVVDVYGTETLYTPPFIEDVDALSPDEWVFGEGCSTSPSMQQQVGQIFGCDLTTLTRPATSWVEFTGLIDLRQTKAPLLAWEQNLSVVPTDSVTVQIAVERGNWMEVYNKPQSVPQAWAEVMVNLERYAGQLIRLRFVLNSPYPSQATFWWFDNIRVTDEK